MKLETISERERKLKYGDWLKFTVVVSATKKTGKNSRFSSNGVLDLRKLLVITQNQKL